jgi:hypothetical protein
LISLAPERDEGAEHDTGYQGGAMFEGQR